MIKIFFPRKISECSFKNLHAKASIAIGKNLMPTVICSQYFKNQSYRFFSAPPKISPHLLTFDARHPAGSCFVIIVVKMYSNTRGPLRAVNIALLTLHCVTSLGSLSNGECSLPNDVFCTLWVTLWEVLPHKGKIFDYDTVTRAERANMSKIPTWVNPDLRYNVSMICLWRGFNPIHPNYATRLLPLHCEKQR